jgi:predicted MFS family arabinose efflux permease
MNLAFLPSGQARRPVLLLALGAFALGTDAFVISGVLQSVSRDLGVSLAVGGLLITMFCGVYAIGGPVLAVATGNVCRRRVMLTALAVFAAANVLAAVAPGYWVLAAARMLAAAAAATYTPAAAATAASLAAPEERGRALTTVLGGLTVANAVGVPLGTLIGQAASWRATFLMVAALGLIAFGGLARSLGPVPSTGSASLAQRLEVARTRSVPPALAAVGLGVAGQFVLYSYLSWFSERAAGTHGSALTLLYLLFGVGAVISNFTGGWLIDRGSPALVAGISLACAGLVFAAFAAFAVEARSAADGYVMGVLVTLWGLAGWMFYPGLQKILATITGPRSVIALSLAASSAYAGQAVAGVLGGLLLGHGAASLAAVAALCEAVALGFLVVTSRRLRPGIAVLDAATPAAVGSARCPSPESGGRDAEKVAALWPGVGDPVE